MLIEDHTTQDKSMTIKVAIQLLHEDGKCTHAFMFLASK
jgi:hypothetical protein